MQIHIQKHDGNEQWRRSAGLNITEIWLGISFPETRRNHVDLNVFTFPQDVNITLTWSCMFPPRFRNTETHDFALGIALVMIQFFWKSHGPPKFYTRNLVFIRNRFQHSCLMCMLIKQEKNKVLRKEFCVVGSLFAGVRCGQSALCVVGSLFCCSHAVFQGVSRLLNYGDHFKYALIEV